MTKIPDTSPSGGPPSPCVKLCQLDASGRTCLGCRRTLEEIATWSRMSGEARRQVLARIEAAGTHS